ncbi:MAG: hypothetical protein ACPG06_01335 [Alphaproteobacteria bacterium]
MQRVLIGLAGVLVIAGVVAFGTLNGLFVGNRTAAEVAAVTAPFDNGRFPKAMAPSRHWCWPMDVAGAHRIMICGPRWVWPQAMRC